MFPSGWAFRLNLPLAHSSISEYLNKPRSTAEILVSEDATTPPHAKPKPRVLGTPDVSERILILNGAAFPNGGQSRPSGRGGQTLNLTPDPHRCH